MNKLKGLCSKSSVWKRRILANFSLVSLLVYTTTHCVLDAFRFQEVRLSRRMRMRRRRRKGL